MDISFVRRSLRPLLTAMALIALLAHFATPSYAAETPATITRTVTEAQINASYRITSPRNRAVTMRSVDLQPGKVVITSELSFPKGKKATLVVTIAPTVADGRVTWNLVSATRDGEPVSQDLFEQIQKRISSSWARYAKEKAGNGRVVSVSISDSEISWTLAPKP